MRHSFLFPARCKALGLVVAIPAIVVGAVMLSDGASVLWGMMGGYFDEFLLVVLTISLLALAFARERVEDEYTTYLRARSLVFAVIVNYLILMIGTCIVFGTAYLNFILVNLFTPLLIYILHFNISILRLKNSMPHE